MLARSLREGSGRAGIPTGGWEFASSISPPGGILESFGRLFENDLKVYAYPEQDAATAAVIGAENLAVQPHLRHLYDYLYENRFIESLRGYDASLLSVRPADVLARIASGDGAWERMVPEPVVRIVKQRGLWGYGQTDSPLNAKSDGRG